MFYRHIKELKSPSHHHAPISEMSQSGTMKTANVPGPPTSILLGRYNISKDIVCHGRGGSGNRGLVVMGAGG